MKRPGPGCDRTGPSSSLELALRATGCITSGSRQGVRYRFTHDRDSIPSGGVSVFQNRPLDFYGQSLRGDTSDTQASIGSLSSMNLCPLSSLRSPRPLSGGAKRRRIVDEDSSPNSIIAATRTVSSYADRLGPRVWSHGLRATLRAPRV
jgi:hypothetical protein